MLILPREGIVNVKWQRILKKGYFMKRVLLAFAVAITLIFSTISVFATKNSNSNFITPPVVKKMQANEVKQITIQFHGKEKKITNKYRIKSMKKLLKSKYYIRTPKRDAGKGWIYTIRGKSSKGKTLSKITVVDAKHVSISGKTYAVVKLDLKKIRYYFKNGNKTSLLSSKKIKSLNIQFHGKYRNTRSKNKIKKIKKIFSQAKIAQTKNTTGKGWIYRIKAKNKKGKVLEEILVIDKNHIIYMGDTYKCKLNLKKLDKLFKINRF